MSKCDRKSLSVTDIAGLGICEQQAVLDARHGKARSAEMIRQAQGGIKAHAKYDKQLSATFDPRCFIASAVFGGQAPETHKLRNFRDRRLMGNHFGRAFCRLYYYLSPKFVPLLISCPRLMAICRFALRAIANRINPVETGDAND